MHEDDNQSCILLPIEAADVHKLLICHLKARPTLKILNVHRLKGNSVINFMLKIGQDIFRLILRQACRFFVIYFKVRPRKIFYCNFYVGDRRQIYQDFYVDDERKIHCDFYVGDRQTDRQTE